MKKIILFLLISFCGFLFAQNFNSSDEKTLVINDSSEKKSEKSKKITREVIYPDAKRPKTPDSEKVNKAALKDEGKNAVQEKQETILYGIETEILSLIKDLIANDDPRFSNELYDLFYSTKSVQVREKLIEYFTKQKDPCIEDYAVEILDDPYDTKDSTVELLFRYVSEVKTKEAIPCIMNLLDSEDETYFTGALAAIGEIGGESEAEHLVEYLERDDFTVPQRQNLMKVLGKLQALSTWEKLCEICQDEEENSFVRMYAAEAIGNMKLPDSIPILVDLFENSDPNFRVYVVKGISNFDTKDSKNIIIQGIKDAHWKVRQESILCAQKMKISDAVPYIIYRAKNDPEKVIKDKAFEALSKMNNSEANKFLIEQITDDKASDSAKNSACKVLLENANVGQTQIAELALKIVKDDRRKPLRYNIGKIIAKHSSSAFGQVCYEYLCSKDAQTCALGLDMYASGRYEIALNKVEEIAKNDKAGANQKKAKKILKIDE